MKLKLFSLAILALAFVGFSAFSPPPIYMKLGDIKGEVVEKDHKNWIILESCQMDGGKLFVHKQLDKSSPLLARAHESGQKFPQAIIDISNEPGLQVLRVVMTDVLVSSYSVSSAGGSSDLPMESLSLNFAKARFVLTDNGVRKNLNEQQAKEYIQKLQD